MNQYSFQRLIRGLWAISACSLFLLPVGAFGLSLDEAKGKGLVGEDKTGYLGSVTAAPGVDELVQDINSKRRQKYQEIAKQNGTSLAAVEGLAAQKAIEATPAGQYIRSSGDIWVKK